MRGTGEESLRETEQEGRRGETKEERRGWRPEKYPELSFISTHPFIDFSVLQLDKASADSSNVALLVREGDPPGSLGVLQLGVCVDAGVANATVQAVHDHGQLHCGGGGGRHASNELIKTFPKSSLTHRIKNVTLYT